MTTEANTKELNLYQKLAAITGEIGTVAKAGKNKEQGYNFIEYAAVAGLLRSLFAKYNVICLPKMGERQATEVTTSRGTRGTYVLIHFEFTFINGDKPEEREVIPWIGEALDYGDKATNKAATGALKYCLMRTFNVSEKGDEDPDQHSIELGQVPVEPPTPKTMTIQDAIAKIVATLASKGFKEADERKTIMLKLAGVEDQKDLKAEHVKHVMDVIESTTAKELRGYLEVEQVDDITIDEDGFVDTTGGDSV